MEVGRISFGTGLELARLLVGTNCKWKLEEDEGKLCDIGVKRFLRVFFRWHEQEASAQVVVVVGTSSLRLEENIRLSPPRISTLAFCTFHILLS